MRMIYTLIDIFIFCDNHILFGQKISKVDFHLYTAEMILIIILAWFPVVLSVASMGFVSCV